jgi:hypothetical protein
LSQPLFVIGLNAFQIGAISDFWAFSEIAFFA